MPGNGDDDIQLPTSQQPGLSEAVSQWVILRPECPAHRPTAEPGHYLFCIRSYVPLYFQNYVSP